jgi:hypothetical protein
MVQYRYTDKATCPPGEWRYKHPITGLLLKHYDYRAFIKAYVNHCLANNIVLTGDWEDELISEMCIQNGWGKLCKPVSLDKVVRRKLSLQAVLSFLNMIKSWAMQVLNGRAAFVSQEEAERRANICAGCPNNVTLQFSCGACMGGVMKLIHGVLGDRKTKNDYALGACLVCSCELKSAVHVPLDVQQRAK